MEFWNSILTEKSEKILFQLVKEPFEFILIGGWAAYFWTKLHKSKDIDIVLMNLNDLEHLKTNYELKKNTNLRKYEITIDEIDVDIYVPFYSRLSIPVENLKKHTTRIQNINVITPEALLILKQGAEIDRSHSVKGMKDRIDIMTLLFFSEIDFKKYNTLLKKYKLETYEQRLKQIIENFTEIKYLGLNPREFKLKKGETLKRL